MVLLLTEALEISAISKILELGQFLCFDVRSSFRWSPVVFFIRLLLYWQKLNFLFYLCIKVEEGYCT